MADPKQLNQTGQKSGKYLWKALSWALNQFLSSETAHICTKVCFMSCFVPIPNIYWSSFFLIAATQRTQVLKIQYLLHNTMFSLNLKLVMICYPNQCSYFSLDTGLYELEERYFFPFKLLTWHKQLYGTLVEIQWFHSLWFSSLFNTISSPV